MDNFIEFYKEQLDLHDSVFSRIVHEDAMVAIVFKVNLRNGTNYILKICERPNDFLHELYFLNYFDNKLPVPKIIQVIEPKPNIMGAILMECFSGSVLKITNFTDSLAFDAGVLLARIHINRTSGYGDLIQQNKLSSDPRDQFTMKFEEGLAECDNHLQKELIKQCRDYFYTHLNVLSLADGPCIVHRDFRPGNLIAYNGKLQGIIDWSSARAGFAQEDFCSMEHTDWSVYPASKKPFLEGYGSVRSIPDYYLIMPLLRLNKAIATIGFTVKRNTYNSSNADLYKFNRQFLESFL